MIIPQIGSAQNHEGHNHSTQTATLKVESWQPINKFADAEKNTAAVAAPLINVLNGVSFYSMTDACNSEKVILLKLINSNNYPVLLKWRMSSELPLVVVEIPASSGVEGSCSNNELMVKVLEESEMAKAVKYAFEHLSVSKK